MSESNEFSVGAKGAVTFSERDIDDQNNGLSSNEWHELDEVAKKGFTVNDQLDMKRMGWSSADGCYALQATDE